jgi:Gamma-glutamyl cyclotransferase, AIG2-like
MMQPRRVEVFFYGLFMDEDLLLEKSVTPENRRIASINNFRLMIGNRATLVPFAGGIVYGVLFSLTHLEMDQLYSDPSVNEYRPEAVTAISNGEAVAALCFNLPTVPLENERNSEYASKLKALAQRLGLPPAYVESI